MPDEVAHMTSFWTNNFVGQLSDREFRHAYMADQVRTHIALAIRVLREKNGWSQAELGARCGKPQSWISRLEDPEYGKLSLQTLLEVAEVFDLPLLVQFPDWGDWLMRMKHQSRHNLEKDGFDADQLNRFSSTVSKGITAGRFEKTEFAATSGEQFPSNDNKRAIRFAVAQ